MRDEHVQQAVAEIGHELRALRSEVVHDFGSARVDVDHDALHGTMLVATPGVGNRPRVDHRSVAGVTLVEVAAGPAGPGR
ncbi:hypothetical protein [Nocardia farcinica]|uniref:hypothetical protein n=1 Tax=Nocardia farcinica TaxID=37329 RepID=UPI002453A5DB|nr:hypothetical protein [Nocardia farcinica]